MSQIPQVKMDDKTCQTLAEKFKEHYDGKIPRNVLDDTVKSIRSMPSVGAESYSVTVTVQSYVFYSSVQIESDLGEFSEVFRGDAGGIGAGGGKASGLINLVEGVSLEDLFARTHSFEMNELTGFSNINIFDANSNILCHVVAGGTVFGGFVGGGTGAWK